MSHQLLESPILRFLIALVPSIFLLNILHRRVTPALRWVAISCGGLCITVYVFLSVLNVFRPGLIWHDDGNMLSITAAYIHGQPLYHSRFAPALYSILYGPATFLVWVPILARFSDPLRALHVGTLVANVTNLVVIFLLLRERVSRRAALLLLPIATAFLLSFPQILFGIRGDPWLLLFTSLGLYSALRRNLFLAAITSGIFSGLSIDFKFTVLPVVCLILAILHRRHGLRATLTSGFVCATSALAIFLLPGISLLNYFEWLGLAGRQHLLGSNFISALLDASFLIVPCLLIVFFAPRFHQRTTLGYFVPTLCGLALAGCIVAASKDGAGPWHLWPMIPFLLLWTGYEASSHGIDAPYPEGVSHGEENSSLSPSPIRIRRVVSAIALAATLVTLAFGFHDLFRVIHQPGQAQQRAAEHAAENAINTLAHRRTLGRNLAMGYGSLVQDYRTDLRFELSLNEQEYFFDENALVETIKEGLPMPPGVVQRILGCNDIWLIPHGDIPFSTLRTGVLPMTVTPYLFPDIIRLHFAESHTLLESGQIYDLWSCPFAAARP
jgi:hypothetical protein